MSVIYSCLLFITISISFLLTNAKEYDKAAILGGDDTDPGKINYMVAILSKDNDNNTSIVCGGGIVTEWFVVSAASCFMDKSYKFYPDIQSIATIAVDKKKSSKINDIEIDIERVYVPNKYDTETYRNDIAIVKLKKSLDFKNNKLKGLRLPALRRSTFADKEAVISGYGWDEVSITVDGTGILEVDGSTLGYLYSAKTEVMSNKNCKRYYDDIDDTVLCAKIILDSNRRKLYGTCRLDEGGPLVYKSKTIIGVLSKTTEACDETMEPAQYTRITTQLDFIKNAMNDKVDKMHINTKS